MHLCFEFLTSNVLKETGAFALQEKFFFGRLG